jgi:hypothetical protein
MAWYWPTVEDESSAEQATKAAVGVSWFIAGLTGLLAVLSIFYHKPIFGIDGLGLIDAAIFALIAWRISKLSRTWAVVGLLMYLLEVGYKLATNPGGAMGVLTIIFILIYSTGFVGRSPITGSGRPRTTRSRHPHLWPRTDRCFVLPAR